MTIRGADVLLTVGGAIALYTGLTDPKGNPKHLLQTLLQGKTPAAPSSTPSLQPASGGGSAPAAPAAAGTYQAYAQQLLNSYGWSSQWDAFNSLEMAEAGWNPKARNASGAYGIAQALDHGTPATKGSDANQYGGGFTDDATARRANSSDGYAQLQWMMAYIKSRWGSPANAWAGYHTRGDWY